jgi:nucleoid-associated protein YgaU
MVGVAAALMLSACQKPQAKPEAYPVESTPVPALDQSERTAVQPLDTYNTQPVRPMDPEPAYTPPPQPVTIKPAEKSVKPSHGKTYVVQKGDNLTKISKKFYNTPNRWKDIYDANKARVKDPNKLQVGTKLIIP